jgi:hypothetical protein
MYRAIANLEIYLKPRNIFTKLAQSMLNILNKQLQRKVSQVISVVLLLAKFNSQQVI